MVPTLRDKEELRDRMTPAEQRPALVDKTLRKRKRFTTSAELRMQRKMGDYYKKTQPKTEVDLEKKLNA